MDILVNGEKLKLGEYNTIDSLQGIIEFMDTHLGKGIVKAVEVDGEEYTVEEIEENKKLNMDEVSRVNFITAASDDLKSSIAFDIKEKLPQIRKDFKRAAAEFTLGDELKGAEIAKEALESMHINYMKLEAWLKDLADEEVLNEFYSLKGDYDDVIQKMALKDEGPDTKVLANMAEEASKLIKKLEDFIEELDTPS